MRAKTIWTASTILPSVGRGRWSPAGSNGISFAARHMNTRPRGHHICINPIFVLSDRHIDAFPKMVIRTPPSRQTPNLTSSRSLVRAWASPRPSHTSPPYQCHRGPSHFRLHESCLERAWPRDMPLHTPSRPRCSRPLDLPPASKPPPHRVVCPDGLFEHSTGGCACLSALRAPITVRHKHTRATDCADPGWSLGAGTRAVRYFLKVYHLIVLTPSLLLVHHHSPPHLP